MAPQDKCREGCCSDGLILGAIIWHRNRKQPRAIGYLLWPHLIKERMYYCFAIFQAFTYNFKSLSGEQKIRRSFCDPIFICNLIFKFLLWAIKAQNACSLSAANRHSETVAGTVGHSIITGSLVPPRQIQPAVPTPDISECDCIQKRSFYRGKHIRMKACGCISAQCDCILITESQASRHLRPSAEFKGSTTHNLSQKHETAHLHWFKIYSSWHF